MPVCVANNYLANILRNAFVFPSAFTISTGTGRSSRHRSDSNNVRDGSGSSILENRTSNPESISTLIFMDECESTGLF